jgi:hypothetical protein
LFNSILRDTKMQTKNSKQKNSGRLDLDELMVSADVVRKPSQSVAPKVASTLESITKFATTKGFFLFFFGHALS